MERLPLRRVEARVQPDEERARAGRDLCAAGRPGGRRRAAAREGQGGGRDDQAGKGATHLADPTRPAASGP